MGFVKPGPALTAGGGGLFRKELSAGWAGLFEGFDEEEELGGHRVVQLGMVGEGAVAAAGWNRSDAGANRRTREALPWTTWLFRPACGIRTALT